MCPGKMSSLSRIALKDNITIAQNIGLNQIIIIYLIGVKVASYDFEDTLRSVLHLEWLWERVSQLNKKIG